MENPLVSIGIPTFNRPDGLARTLNRITNQTYKNLEIIVSDNCSPTNETELLVNELMKKDSRIRFFKQEKNMGVTFNFHFVLSKASANYFMWATDDDYFESPDLVEKLLAFAPFYLLIFTNYNFITAGVVSYNHFTPIFNTCKKKLDYIYAFCNYEYGHPSTGMYNLQLLKEAGIQLLVAEDLCYHMEGLLLHKIFNDGRIKYVDDVLINYSTNSRESSSLNPLRWGNDYIKYTKRVLSFYLFNPQGLMIKDRIKLVAIILNNHRLVYNQIIKYQRPKGVSQTTFFINLTIPGSIQIINLFQIVKNLQLRVVKKVRKMFKS